MDLSAIRFRSISSWSVEFKDTRLGSDPELEMEDLENEFQKIFSQQRMLRWKWWWHKWLSNGNLSGQARFESRNGLGDSNQ